MGESGLYRICEPTKRLIETLREASLDGEWKD